MHRSPQDSGRHTSVFQKHARPHVHGPGSAGGEGRLQTPSKQQVSGGRRRRGRCPEEVARFSRPFRSIHLPVICGKVIVLCSSHFLSSPPLSTQHHASLSPPAICPTHQLPFETPNRDVCPKLSIVDPSNLLARLPAGPAQGGVDSTGEVSSQLFVRFLSVNNSVCCSAPLPSAMPKLNCAREVPP